MATGQLEDTILESIFASLDVSPLIITTLIWSIVRIASSDNHATMSVPRARLLDLMKVQCNVFSTTYNPEGIRMGNKILRQRLKGAALASYYPKRLVTFRDLKNTFAPELSVLDWEDVDRLEHLDGLRSRGKGSAKKKDKKK